MDVEVVSPERANIYIPEDYVPKIIGKNGKRIAEIEQEIGISLGVEVIEDKPVNKMLHLTTSFLSSVVKSSLKDCDAKRGVAITAIMVDLAIDFFCKK